MCVKHENGNMKEKCGSDTIIASSIIEVPSALPFLCVFKRAVVLTGVATTEMFVSAAKITDDFRNLSYSYYIFLSLSLNCIVDVRIRISERGSIMVIRIIMPLL